MIERIQLIRNVGQFDNVSPGQQTSFSGMTLIYAENGRGKTTLANLLRSLSTNNPTLIEERKRLRSGISPHANADPHIVVQANGQQSFVFQNGAWQTHLPEIAIFDDHFVVENVYSGVAVDSGHKQKLHELILGAQGIALNEALKGHISKIEEHNRNLKTKEAAIPAKARGVMNVEDFCALQQNPNIDDEIQQAERNLAAAKDADPINKQGEFKPLSLPAFDPAEIEAILQRDLPGLQVEATTRVKQHLEKLGKGAESWIGEGMQKIADSSDDEQRCPFCDQELKDSDIIAHYETYFSEAYTSLKQAITDIGKAIADAHKGEIQSAFERAVSEAIQNGEFWRKFTDIPVVQVDTAEIARAWKAALEPILEILRAKLASPLEKMTLSGDILEAVKSYDGHREAIAELSSSLIKCNDPIKAVKEKAATANVATLTADFNRLKTIKARFEPDVATHCDAYLAEKDEKKKTEGKRDTAKTALEQYRASIFSTYQQAINDYLGRFNAGFRLDSVSAQNNRGGSSCTYNVLINNVSVPLASNNGPSFRNTMSAGDRNTLALAFFFASLDQDAKLAQKIVVIDDPMTSLDEHRSLATIQEVRGLAQRVQQVILLSHSKPFLCEVWQGADKTASTALHIIRSGQSSTIDTWDVTQDCITEHDKRHALIQQYLNQSAPNKAREVATALRYVLESFLRVAYPAYFPPGKMLGPFHSECVQSLTAGTPILNQADADELRKLLDYANKFHHETNAAYATATINDHELVDHCTRTLNFTKRS
jgi:wobble nucleotide-excising tRNase